MAADNSIKILPSPDVLGEPVRTDWDGSGGGHVQYIKMMYGGDGVFTVMDPSALHSLPIQSCHQFGSATHTTPVGTVKQTGTGSPNNLDMRSYELTGIIVPSTFDGTTISFEVSVDGNNFFPLYDATGALVQQVVAASRAYAVWEELKNWHFVRVVCGTSQSTTDTIFTAVYRG